MCDTGWLEAINVNDTVILSNANAFLHVIGSGAAVVNESELAGLPKIDAVECVQLWNLKLAVCYDIENCFVYCGCCYHLCLSVWGPSPSIKKS